MFTYLIATFCLAATCERAVVASSEQDERFTATICRTAALAMIPDWMGKSIKYRDWRFDRFDCIQGERRPDRAT